jgi:hypothetical protein
MMLQQGNFRSPAMFIIVHFLCALGPIATGFAKLLAFGFSFSPFSRHGLVQYRRASTRRVFAADESLCDARATTISSSRAAAAATASAELPPAGGGPPDDHGPFRGEGGGPSAAVLATFTTAYAEVK